MRNLTTTLCLTIAVLFGSAGCSSSVNDLQITNATPYGVQVWEGVCFTPNWERCSNTVSTRAYLHCKSYGKKSVYVRQATKRSSFYKCVETSQTQTSPQKIEEIQQKTHFQKCQEIGFKPKTDKFADCVLRLMEMQSDNRPPRTIIQNNTGDSSAVRALLEEQKRQRELEGSLELMQRGLDMMNPPKPRITCKYNQYTKTTVCN